MSSFKVGDIVCLTQGDYSLNSFVDWAQELMASKARCKVMNISGGSVGVIVLEGKEKGREISAHFKRFKKISSIDGLEVEEL